MKYGCEIQSLEKNLALGERQCCRPPQKYGGPGRVHRNNRDSTDGKFRDSHGTIRPKDGKQNDVWTRIDRTFVWFLSVTIVAFAFKITRRRNKLLDFSTTKKHHVINTYFPRSRAPLRWGASPPVSNLTKLLTGSNTHVSRTINDYGKYQYRPSFLGTIRYWHCG